MTTPSEIENPRTPDEKQQRMLQRERNRRVIEKTQFNYLFLQDSDVFHRRDCKVCLNAKSHARIFGSVYYPKAEKGLRPCKLCKPEPGLLLAPIGSYGPGNRKKRKAKRPFNHADELVQTKMLTGNLTLIQRSRILGWCRHQLHPGAVSKVILKEHRCLSKKCPFFEQNEQSPYWIGFHQQREAKHKRKERRRNRKREKAREQRNLLQLTDRWRALAAGMDSGIQIVRAAKEAPNSYVLFYVSDNRFDDRDRFHPLLDSLKTIHPNYSIVLRHIKDTDGHFVTGEEYRNRRKK